MTEDADSSGATPSDAKTHTSEPAYGLVGTGMVQLVSDIVTCGSNVTPLAASSVPSVTVESRSYWEQLKSNTIRTLDPEAHQSDSAEKGALATTTDCLMCPLCCLLENCLFYLMYWMGLTEMLKILLIAYKMQLLNSIWGEIILREYLRCYHCSEGNNALQAIVFKSPAHYNQEMVSIPCGCPLLSCYVHLANHAK
ncbi:hypothetical protein FBUS_06608 [Fasciolopsis buskii]|uniref:Uncharacterized protein n=1 Tax=Fasciolopsis buskii TaxID=27845 RepID=A0A8E0RW05_9TREM|nr:hypothetical protein FBUS_06608 [Fasciolopsis buski]